jgi:hypothetical protein
VVVEAEGSIDALLMVKFDIGWVMKTELMDSDPVYQSSKGHTKES